MNDWSALPEIERDPDRVSGAWVFRGTRVPVTALFETLRDGATVDQFLEWFPGASRAQVAAVLDHEARLFTAAASTRESCSTRGRLSRCAEHYTAIT